MSGYTIRSARAGDLDTLVEFTLNEAREAEAHTRVSPASWGWSSVFSLRSPVVGLEGKTDGVVPHQATGEHHDEDIAGIVA